MEKPMSLIINESKQAIISAVNKCNLSPTLLEPILRELYEEVKILQQREIDQDTKKYQEYLDSQKDNDE